MPLKKLKEFLNQNNVQYVSIKHSPAYEAQKIAASAHIKGKNLAKTVIVKLEGNLVMAVLPAKYQVDLGRLKAAANKDSAEIAAEPEFADVFPGCDTGAMPPFGNLFDVPVWVDETLASDEEIAFNAGSYSELLQLSYKDFEVLVRPQRASFSVLLH